MKFFDAKGRHVLTSASNYSSNLTIICRKSPLTHHLKRVDAGNQGDAIITAPLMRHSRESGNSVI
jgi:hypothetical protein